MEGINISSRRKALAMLVGNTLFVDAADSNNPNIESWRKQAESMLKQSVTVQIAELRKNIPTSGKKALIDAAIKKLNV